MGYKVIESFCDMQDDGYEYAVGDKFPRADISVSQARIAELVSGKNKLGRPLIILSAQPVKPIEVAKVEEPVPAIEKEAETKNRTAKRSKRNKG